MTSSRRITQASTQETIWGCWGQGRHEWPSPRGGRWGERGQRRRTTSLSNHGSGRSVLRLQDGFRHPQGAHGRPPRAHRAARWTGHLDVGPGLSSIGFFEAIHLLRSTRIVWERLHQMEAQMKWKKRWKNWIVETRIPGIWQRKEGGHLVRSRITDPTTGARREIKKVLPDADLATAHKWLRDEQERIRQGLVEAEQPKTRFADFAVSLLEKKLVTKEIKSARGRERWVHTLRHLIEGTDGVPGFGDIFLDEISSKARRGVAHRSRRAHRGGEVRTDDRERLVAHLQARDEEGEA
jgi:hypothetical protein